MTGVKSEVQTVPGFSNRLSFFPHPAWQIQLGTEQSGDLTETGTETGFYGLLVWAGPGRYIAGATTSKPGPNLTMVGRGCPGTSGLSGGQECGCGLC